jgi:hypothetical protein
MDIAALSILKNQVQLKMDAGTSIMKKVMDTAEQNCSLLTRMLNEAAPSANPPHLGAHLDKRV